MRGAFLALALSLTLPVAAFAQAGTAEEQAACRSDVRRFCHKVMGSDAITDCLKAHRDKLSKTCIAVFEAHGQ
jgi:hypothetical protein